MKRVMVVAVALLLLAAGAGIRGQSKSASLQGVWQTVEFTIASANPQTITVRQPKANLTIFTARHYSRSEDQSETPRAALSDVTKATADELRTVWGPIVAEAGTYEVTGNVLTVHPQVSKNPAAMALGASITYTFRLEGDTLWLIQQKNWAGPYPNPVTFKLSRVE